MTSSGRPVATIIALDDYSHVNTRLKQYEAYKNRKGVEIAKQLVLAKIEAQTQMLKKYRLEGFETLSVPRKEQIALLHGENVDKIRNKLHGVEAKYSQHYFGQIVALFPKELRKNWKGRKGFRAYDELNNLFNVCYDYLKWKIFRSLIKSKLEPFLGFLHGIQENRPSLVCDLEEIYRAISMLLHHRYRISYTTHNPAKDGTLRHVRIDVIVRNNTNSDTASYRAPYEVDPVDPIDTVEPIESDDPVFEVLPNPFTPNDDGLNDRTEFRQRNGVPLNWGISIMDRYGRMIKWVNKEERYWDGKDETGQIMNPGCYLYIISNGDHVFHRGLIQLIR